MVLSVAATSEGKVVGGIGIDIILDGLLILLVVALIALVVSFAIIVLDGNVTGGLDIAVVLRSVNVFVSPAGVKSLGRSRRQFTAADAPNRPKFRLPFCQRPADLEIVS